MEEEMKQNKIKDLQGCCQGTSNIGRSLRARPMLDALVCVSNRSGSFPAKLVAKSAKKSQTNLLERRVSDDEHVHMLDVRNGWVDCSTHLLLLAADD